jgi:hypothetical protein
VFVILEMRGTFAGACRDDVTTGLPTSERIAVAYPFHREKRLFGYGTKRTSPE